MSRAFLNARLQLVAAVMGVYMGWDGELREPDTTRCVLLRAEERAEHNYGYWFEQIGVSDRPVLNAQPLDTFLAELYPANRADIPRQYIRNAMRLAELQRERDGYGQDTAMFGELVAANTATAGARRFEDLSWLE